MTYKLIAALVFSLGLGTAAIAQTTPQVGTPTGGQGNSPALPQWDTSVNDAFFADTTAGTLRSEEDIRANWSSLPAEQQAQVRADCDTMTTASVGTSATGTGGDTTASGGADAGAGTQIQAMNDLCDMVGGM